jgi:hypothetical protein
MNNTCILCLQFFDLSYTVSVEKLDTEYMYYSWCMTSTDIVKWRKKEWLWKFWKKGGRRKRNPCPMRLCSNANDMRVRHKIWTLSGRLSLMRNVQLMKKYMYTFRVYHIRIIAKKNWFTRHETDVFLNNHYQECIRAYLSIHDYLSFLHDVMIGNHRTKTFLHEVMIGNHRNKTTEN